jgi:hypothetical protein
MRGNLGVGSKDLTTGTLGGATWVLRGGLKDGILEGIVVSQGIVVSPFFVNFLIVVLLLIGYAQPLGIECRDDRQETVRILCRHGSQVGEGTNENHFCETTA